VPNPSPSGAGELQRLRYVIERFFSVANWYRTDQNPNFGGIGVTKTEVQGSGLGAHITAVGLHTWSGSARFPVITSALFHTTGFWWPTSGNQPAYTVQHHLALSVDSGVERDRTGVEIIRFHLQAVQFHHTVALRYAHSQAGLASWQYPHITAISLTQAGRGPDGTQPPAPATGYDQLIFGHASTVLRMVGYGASHIALGSGAYLALGRHVGTLAPAAPLGNALYADTIVKAWANFDGSLLGGPVSRSFNVASITRNGVGDYTVTWQTGFVAGHYAMTFGSRSSGFGSVGTVESSTATGAGSARIANQSTTGTSIDCVECMLIVVGQQ